MLLNIISKKLSRSVVFCFLAIFRYEIKIGYNFVIIVFELNFFEFNMVDCISFNSSGDKTIFIADFAFSSTSFTIFWADLERFLKKSSSFMAFLINSNLIF